MNFKKHMLLVAGGGAAAVLFVIALIFLIKSSGHYSQVTDSLDKSERELERLQNRDPFPSADNIDLENENSAVLRDQYLDLRQRLSTFQFNLQSMEPAQFSELYGNTRRELLQEALEAGIIVPDNFTFGFDRYAQGSPPASDHVERLNVQLQMVEALCELIYETDVMEIQNIKRTVFETSQNENRDESQRTDRRRSVRGRAPAGDDAGQKESLEAFVDDQQIFTAESFTIELKTRESALWDLMNKVAASPLLISFNDVHINNGKQKQNYSKKLTPEQPAPAADVRLQEKPAVKPPPLSREERVIAGREDLQVTLDVNIFRFLENGEKEKK